MFTKMKKQSRVPSSETALQRAFENCEKQGRFKAVESTSFSDYLLRAQKDLSSAERDLQGGDYHWARIKGYQALFHALNALLVKKKGFFSKDHGCVLVALIKNEIITEELVSQLHLLMSSVLKQVTVQTIYDDIDEFRIQRNFALYKPKAWEEVKKEDVARELEKIQKNIAILVVLL
ncbi:HEPN domain-containing protein [Candidatus Woesearchaeota archaeon]|nr:HEPN domain-containing protein [Candidatus Woesearchaeota archaeon]